MAMSLLATADAHLSAGRYAEAESIYRNVVESNPRNAHAQYGLGRSLGKLRQYEESIAAFRRAVDIEPHLASAYLGLGAIYGICGRYAESEVELRQAIMLEPNNADAHMNLSVTYRMQGQFDDALKVGERAFALKPSLSAALQIIRAAAGKYPKGSLIILAAIVLGAFTANSAIGFVIVAAWFGSVGWIAILAFHSGDRRKGAKITVLALLMAIMYILRRGGS